ncbi:phage antirepressor KilAC domain-containing protein [Clostridium sp.]|uniref:phage antirepressor KilAC domain-containing protein n=1 Tax=Clostridium sp. TaxID=1506 RepID=UPI001A37F64C|nr:phage antirepressor KilAC domain-containing protein [Clostridium sp.]MBK5234093.1 phage antirepressor KilAC domain-containing protein [Clostridium sp.]
MSNSQKSGSRFSIKHGASGKHFIVGQDLYNELFEIREYKYWITMLFMYDFKKDRDYFTFKSWKPGTKIEKIDYAFTLEMCSMVCFLQKSPIGTSCKKIIDKLIQEYDLKKSEEFKSAADQIESLENTISSYAKSVHFLKYQNESLEARIKEMNDSIKKVAIDHTGVDCIEYADSDEALFTTTEVARKFGLSAVKLNQILRDLGVQYKVFKIWRLDKKYAGLGYLKIEKAMYLAADGTEKVKTLQKWTTNGKYFVYDILEKNHIEMRK